MAKINENAFIFAKFHTKEEKYVVSNNPLSISITTTSEQLNDIIKTILSSENNKENLDKITFDFYINNQYIDSSIKNNFDKNKQIETESIIEIEYTIRHPPPEPYHSITLNDWVSCIRGCNDLILVGCYDHSVQLWNVDSQLLTNVVAHKGSVKAVEWISNDVNNETYNFISGSQDQTLILWKINNKTNTIDSTEICIGHKESVECVAVDMKCEKFISGSWDKTIKLWKLDNDLEVERPVKKTKREFINNKIPILTLSGHNENVSTCKWIDDTSICTASWDHTIKLWDVFKGNELLSLLNPNKIFLSIDYSQLNNLIVAGLNDRHIRLYDPRSCEGNIVKSTFSSHTAWCSSVCWSKTNEYAFVSGSYDNLVKIWDIRNNKTCVYDLTGHDDKVLSIDWLNEYVLSGSADGTVKIYSYSGNNIIK